MSWYEELPPEYDMGEPDEHTCRFCNATYPIEEYEFHECEEPTVICEECLTHTLEDFVTNGRCEECAAPVEEAPVSLVERLKIAHRKALDARDLLLAAKIVQWTAQVERVEAGLRELEAGRG